MACIAVTDLSKTYNIKAHRNSQLGLRNFFYRPRIDKVAVDNISFSIDQGEIVGFLGPNGAGKSTTLKMLSGLLYPTSGQVKVLDFDPSKREKAFLRNISLIAGQRHQLIWDIPAKETFKLNKAIFDIPDSTFKKTYKFLDELLEIGGLADAPVRNLSLGERMKCEIAAALLHEPKIIFLDEPTIGLDVEVQQAMRRLIREYCKERGATVLLTSHYLKDIYETCERVLVISGGQIAFSGSLNMLVAQTMDRRSITIKLSQKVDSSYLRTYGAVTSRTDHDHTIVVASHDVTSIATRLLSELPIHDISVGEVPVEEALMEIFAKSRERHRPAPLKQTILS